MAHLTGARTRSRNRYLAYLAVVALQAARAALAQQPPSADELCAMYCVSVLRAEIGLQQHMLAVADDAGNAAGSPAQRQEWRNTGLELLEGLSKLQDTLLRLQGYMLMRIQKLDAYALADALRLGDAEFQASRASVERCPGQCAASAPEEQQACLAGCTDPALLARLSACDNPTWLAPAKP